MSGVTADQPLIIAGAGIGGLVLALQCHARGIPVRILETAPELKPIGVGINLLPHATKDLAALGLLPALSAVAVETKEAVFFNRFGQLIYGEPLGRAAGYAEPQLSIHRGDLHMVLLAAVRERLGKGAVETGRQVDGFIQDDTGVTVEIRDQEPVRGAALIGADGIHSVVRKRLHPGEGDPKYSGVNMWRGTVAWKPFLSGGSMVRAGWLTQGKMVIYPIRDAIDAEGRQLVNWVAEIETPRHKPRRDWNRPGELGDFLPAFADWRFDWLDVAGMLQATRGILEFPMVDQDPLPFWTRGRVTLLGDAAHPMVPRGSNGAGQAILDARVLADLLTRMPVADALAAYEVERLPATSKVVEMNRRNPPDAIIREVWRRSGDKPFGHIDEVISRAELKAISDRYKTVAGYDLKTLRG